MPAITRPSGSSIGCHSPKRKWLRCFITSHSRGLNRMFIATLPHMRGEFQRSFTWLDASRQAWRPTHTMEQILDRIQNGRAYLWTGSHSAVVGELIDHPIGFRSFNYWLQGGDLDDLLKLHPEIEEWARVNHCQRAMGMGRPAW